MSESKVISSSAARINLISDGSDPNMGFRKVIAHHYKNENTGKDVFVVKYVIGAYEGDQRNNFWIYDQNKHIFDIVAEKPDHSIKIQEFIEDIKKPRTACLCSNGLFYMNWYPPQRGRVPSVQCTICTFEVTDPNHIQVCGEGLWNWKHQTTITTKDEPVIRGVVVALTDMEKTMTVEVNGRKWLLSEKTRPISS